MVREVAKAVQTVISPCQRAIHLGKILVQAPIDITKTTIKPFEPPDFYTEVLGRTSCIASENEDQR
jgi:hypothetical protein